MKAGEVVILRMKSSSFAGTQMIGRLVSVTAARVCIKETAICHEIIQQDNQGNVALRPAYFISPIHTDGTWEFDRTGGEIVGMREVSEDDKAMKLYEEAITRWKVEKAGLVAANGSSELPTGRQPEAGL
jgi:hypothetical protein